MTKLLDARRNDCPHAALCGGCAYSGCAYGDTFRKKEEQVRQLLAPVLSVQNNEVLWEESLRAPQIFGYRNKMEFSFGDERKDGPLTLGLHRRKSFYDIVSVPECRIIDADFRLILRTVLDYFAPLHAQGTVGYYHRKRKTGYLRHLLLRKGKHTGRMLIDLVTTSMAPASEDLLLTGFAEAILLAAPQLNGRISGILHTRNDRAADAVLDGGTRVLYGEDSFEEELMGMHFTITPFSFFQTNTDGAELVYRTLERYVMLATDLCPDGKDEKKNGLVYDLYCGTGTITQLMSKSAARVVGVELVPEAVESARTSARSNHADNCEFLCGDVLQVLDALHDAPDVIIVDPPRAGLHPKVLPKLVSCGAKAMVYVSCKPESLARDLPFLLAHGYEAKRLTVIDQFPWTGHVETVVLMSRIKEK